jgi:hypothetical protein
MRYTASAGSQPIGFQATEWGLFCLGRRWTVKSRPVGRGGFGKQKPEILYIICVNKEFWHCIFLRFHLIWMLLIDTMQKLDGESSVVNILYVNKVDKASDLS